MLTIWKQVLPVMDEQTIFVPKGAEFLTAQEQYNQVCVWFRRDPKEPVESRKIRICGTGHPTAPNDKEGKYLGTANTEGGELMWHVFEIY